MTLATAAACAAAAEPAAVGKNIAVVAVPAGPEHEEIDIVMNIVMKVMNIVMKLMNIVMKVMNVVMKSYHKEVEKTEWQQTEQLPWLEVVVEPGPGQHVGQCQW